MKPAPPVIRIFIIALREPALAGAGSFEQARRLVNARRQRRESMHGAIIMPASMSHPRGGRVFRNDATEHLRKSGVIPSGGSEWNELTESRNLSCYATARFLNCALCSLKLAVGSARNDTF